MPVAKSLSRSHQVTSSNRAYDANRRRAVHGPLQPMDEDRDPMLVTLRALWRRLTGG